MSVTHPPQKVKLVMGFIFSDEKELAATLETADQQYGPLDFFSERLPFDFTSYYEPEMGKSLWRRVASFQPLIDPEQLAEIKLWTNQLETLHTDEQRGRKVNIDPGYLAASRFILATGKDYSHRVYLRQGIYADLTLLFEDRAFKPLPWTYPDYASEPLVSLLSLLRKRYLWQLKNERVPGSKGSSEACEKQVVFPLEP
jgi:hypothetical protein